MYNGKCRDMGDVDAGEISRPGQGRLPPDRARAGDRLRHRRGHARRDLRKRSSYGKDVALAAAFKDVTRGACTTSSVPQVCRPVAVHVQRRPTRTTEHRGVLGRAAAAARPARGPRLPTNGNGGFEWKGFRAANAPARRPTRRAASWSTGTTSRRRTSLPPTINSHMARCSARRCWPRASPSTRSSTWRRSSAR